VGVKGCAVLGGGGVVPRGVVWGVHVRAGCSQWLSPTRGGRGHEGATHGCSEERGKATAPLCCAVDGKVSPAEFRLGMGDPDVAPAPCTGVADQDALLG